MNLFKLLAITLFMAASLTFSADGATKKTSAVASPDFAYPATVAKNAEAAIARAQRSGDGKALVRALADLALSQAAVGNEKLPAAVNRIEKIRLEEKDQVTRSLLSLLLARIYYDIYTDNKWVYDNRSLPLTPLPEDYTMWSGAQFRNVIDGLCTDGLTPADKLQKEKISAYSSIIKADRLTRIFYPTLYDFAASFTIELRENLSPFSDQFTLLYLSPRRLFEVTAIMVPRSPIDAAVLSTYAEWLRFHEGQPGPTVNIDLMRIEAVASGLPGDVNDSANDRVISLLRELYTEFRDSEYSGMVLSRLYDYNPNSGEADKKELYRLIEDNIRRFPNYFGINRLKNILTQMAQQSAQLSVNSFIAPGHDFDIRLKANNTSSLTIDFYSITPKHRNNDYYTRGKGAERLVKSVTVNMPGTVPFECDTTVRTSLPQEGYYIAVPRAENLVSNSRESYSIIRSSRLALGAMSQGGVGDLYVVDPLTGAPVEGASVLSMTSSRYNSTFSPAGTTDKNGFYSFNISNQTTFAANKGTDKYSKPMSVSTSRQPERSDTFLMSLTDLSLYHPGDTVKWVAVVYSAFRDTKKPLANVEITANLRVANGVDAGTMTAVTDEFGRAAGSFAIPKNGLTGGAYIEFRAPSGFSYSRFKVSDYKLPTFQPEITAVDMNSPAAGDVTIRGKARTYSGVAVEGAAVKLNLAVAKSIWWMRSNDIEFYFAETATDGYGNFTVTIPKVAFETSPAPDGIFKAQITVTSADGETHQTSRRFTLGPTYSLFYLGNSAVDVSAPVRLNLKVINGEDRPVNLPVVWTLTSEKGQSVSGTVPSGDPVVDWTGISSGSYRLSLVIEGQDSLHAFTVDPFVIYRPTDKASPVDDVLWTPNRTTTLTSDNHRRATLLFSTLKPDQYVLYNLVNEDSGKVLERRWLRLDAGMHTLDVKLPRDTEKAKGTLSSVFDYECDRIEFNVTTPEAARSLMLHAESFRDRVVPGTEETWTFRTALSDSTDVRAAVMLNMYNSALDGIPGTSVNAWSLSPRSQYYPRFSLHMEYMQAMSFMNVHFNNPKMLSVTHMADPSWIFYGRSFSTPRVVRQYKTSRLMNAMAVEEEADGGVLYDTAAPEASMKAMVGASAGIAVKGDEETAETTEEQATDVEAEEPVAAEQPFAYRDSEVTTAFFAPILTTDAQGRLTYSFTVPNANTTWNFQALAYNDRFLTTDFAREVLANKPVMVQPNLPRFLRCGDKATVKATVMNNTGKQQTISTVVEIFDLVSGQIVATESFSSVIEAESSATVSSILTAPADAPFIGYRIKSSTDRFADGEQAAIPVLPFTTPVIETKPFYMPTDTTALTLRLPDMPADARVTLQYCDNPTWYVVTALPGLRKADPRTSVEAAAAIYSAAIADGLLRTRPEIADVLRRWTESDRSDSTLTSMLERNGDLKTVLLEATPWMMDARSDTERMERLALLFNRAEIDAVYAKAVDCLDKLRCPDGGFAWSTFMNESSSWATYNLLYALGRLNALGFMPDNATLRGYITPALQYIQSINVRDFKKYPKADYTSFVRLLDLWPDFKPSTSGAAVIAAAVQRTVGSWKKMNVSDKALAASMLSRHGYKSVALDILRSLREYAVSSPTEGMYWPSVGDLGGGTMWQLGVAADALEAFALLDPQSPDVDLIRQWLILQKETRDWGSSATASQVIASILLTSKTWVKPAESFSITIGDRAVVPASLEKTLGYFRTDVSQLAPSGRLLHIDKSAASPAWGAVYCRYTADMTQVKPQSCDALSIEKKLLKQSGNDWVETSDIAVGDRVKVLLTVRANRDLEYVAITDDRAACLEPVEQLPAPIYSEGICFYRENRDSVTNLFVGNMPRGSYQLSYELWVNNAGTFASGIATAQSQYAPQIEAHSAGCVITAK